MAEFSATDTSTWDPTDPQAGFKIGEALGGELGDVINRFTTQRLIPAMQWVAEHGHDVKPMVKAYVNLLETYTTELRQGLGVD